MDLDGFRLWITPFPSKKNRSYQVISSSSFLVNRNVTNSQTLKLAGLAAYTTLHHCPPVGRFPHARITAHCVRYGDLPHHLQFTAVESKTGKDDVKNNFNPTTLCQLGEKNIYNSNLRTDGSNMECMMEGIRAKQSRFPTKTPYIRLHDSSNQALRPFCKLTRWRQISNLNVPESCSKTSGCKTMVKSARWS